MQWSRWMHGARFHSRCLPAAIWYIILVHTASREPLRWWRYLPPIFAGIASVWLLHWWQGTLNYTTNPDEVPRRPPMKSCNGSCTWVLPEEGGQAFLFAFFLPVLLHHRSGVKAALTAGCVGLGFALDENLHYFRETTGHMVAIRG